MAGPAPKPEGLRARRNATIAMTKLPAAGRRGRAPVWPLIPDVVLSADLEFARSRSEEAWDGLDDEGLTSRERSDKKRAGEKWDRQVAILEAKLNAQRELEAKLWHDLWKTPQATQWQKLRWTRDVAQYVRHKVLGELGSINDAKEARMQADRLGLTPLSMLRLRWEVASDSPAVSRSRSHRDRNTAAARAAAANPEDPRAILHAVS